MRVQVCPGNLDGNGECGGGTVKVHCECSDGSDAHYPLPKHILPVHVYSTKL